VARPIPVSLPGFLKRVEGVRHRAYRDSAGVWTIGVGHTGPEVDPAAVWTEAQVDAALARDIRAAANRLAAVVRPAPLEALSEHQYAALLSFVFNLGANPKWTLWKVIAARQFDGVPTQLLRFTKARDPKTGRLVEVRGLVHRRMAEVALWKTADVQAAETIAASAQAVPPPSGFMRLSDTPPEPMPVKPLTRSKSFWTSVSAAAAALASAALPVIEPAAHGARTAVDAIAPFADGSAVVANWRSFLLTAAAILALAAPLLIALKTYRGRVQ
jgi:GH24 family phage-related lysozyme (muramidase)